MWNIVSSSPPPCPIRANQPAAPPPDWSIALRALREAGGTTQEGWAAQIGRGRRTVQRWERGEAVPNESDERAILKVCREKGLFRAYAQGPLCGVSVTPEWLRDVLAEARLATTPMQATAPVHRERESLDASTSLWEREQRWCRITVVTLAAVAFCLGLAGMSVEHRRAAPAPLPKDRLALVGPLAVSPPSPDPGQSVEASFTVENAGDQAVSMQYFLTGARDPDGDTVDFPASPSITLAPSQRYTYRQSRTFSKAGRYTAWPAYYNGGPDWPELSPRMNFAVGWAQPDVGAPANGALVSDVVTLEARPSGGADLAGVQLFVFYSISGNTRASWSIVNARKVIGYEPEDDSELTFADEIRAHLVKR